MNIPNPGKEAISPVINSYQCKDGKWIFLSILEHERYFRILCDQVLDRADLAEDDRFSTTLEAKKNAAVLIRILDQEFRKHTQDEMVERLTKADIAHERIQHVKDVLSDPQAIENQYIMERSNRDGTKTMYAATPVKFGSVKAGNDYDAPLVGQDSEEILAELGYPREDILRWMDDGIVTVVKA